MTLKRSWSLSLLMVVLLLGASMVAEATGNFATVTLPKGVSIDLPTNWVLLSNNQRKALDTFVESRLDLSGIPSEFPFAANYNDDHGNAIGTLNVHYFPRLDLSQSDAHGATSRDVQRIDATVKENIFKEMKTFGMSITSWTGTSKTDLNGITAFVTEYRHTPPKGAGDFRARLVGVFADDKSFILTVSYKDSASMVLRPISDRIIGSLKLAGVPAPTSRKGKTMEHMGTQLAEAFGGSLGKVLGLILPIGLFYGKLFRKYSWVTIGAAIPIAAVLDAIVIATVGTNSPYMLLIGAGACLAGIEVASHFHQAEKAA